MKDTQIHLQRALLLAIMLLLLIGLPLASSAQEPVKLKIIFPDNELSNDQMAAFEEANPDIDLVRPSGGVSAVTLQDFELELASGEPPDIMRVSAVSTAGLYHKGLVLDITDYLENSKLIDINNLSNAVNYYKFDDRFYGLPKDWSLDFTLFINTKAFEDAGIPIPDDKEPITYAQLAEYAKKLTIRNGDEVVQMGLAHGFFERTITLIVMQRGGQLFNEDFSAINLTNNPIAAEVLHYFYDLAEAGAIYTTLSPSPSWKALADGYAAMQISGYWYNATVTPESPVFGHVKLLPAPTWDPELPRLNTTYGPSGIAIYAETPHPEEAFRFLEWYIAGQPAVDRARSGWGLPILRSLESELPKETELQRQALAVSQAEMEFSDFTLPIYPYNSISTAFEESWDRNLELALAGSITFEEMLANMEEEINLAILDETLTTGQ